MISVTETDTGLWAVDAEKNEISIRTVDWTCGGPPYRIDRRVDATITGSATELEFPEAAVCIESASKEQWRTFDSRTSHVELPDDNHLIQITGNIICYIRFNGTAKIQRVKENTKVNLSFSSKKVFTIGFRSLIRKPRQQLSIPATPEGLAVALSYMSSAIETSTPDKSYPSVRRHPPTINLATEYHIPDAISNQALDTGIQLKIPCDFPSLFVVAPLAYYLQASVSVEDRNNAVLIAPEVDLSVNFCSLPEFQHEAADLLYQIFFLDCLTRNIGPYSVELTELSSIEPDWLNFKRAYYSDPQERLAIYLNTSFEEIKTNLPKWHLSMYVKPTVEHISIIPYILDRLSLVYLPNASALDAGKLIKRSLDDTYVKYPLNREHEPIATVTPLSPELHRGRVHGWLADGIPIDVFKMLPEGFSNRFNYFTNDQCPTTVTVISNDPTMDSESLKVNEVYCEKMEQLNIDIEIKKDISKESLMDIFRQQRDFIHFIGHCNTNGLQCSDGNLSISDIEESNVQTFFLNACGSYYEGLELIKKGSVAGAVTLATVLDKPATMIGITFARLMINGFNIEHALELAKRQSVINKNYVIVGDGTHRISQGDDSYPSLVKINKKEQDTFILTTKSFSLRDSGAIYTPYITDDEAHTLFGNETCLEVSRDQLVSHLRNSQFPVLYDNKIFWSKDFLSKLAQ